MAARGFSMTAALEQLSTLLHGYGEQQTKQTAATNQHSKQTAAPSRVEASEREAAARPAARPAASQERAARREQLISLMRLAVPAEVTSKPYPEVLVPLWSQKGLALLEAAVGPFAAVAKHMVGQGPLQCGTTSLAIALNASRARGTAAVSVSQLHEDLRERLKPSHKFFSVSLAELGALGQRYAGDAVQVVYASDTSCDEFRQAASDVLEAGGVVVANFKRSELGYASPFAGHCSPLAAYNPAVDEFLVMDVARKSWQPVWVPTQLLFRGMDTMEKPRDESLPASKTRGFLTIEAAGAPRRFVL